MAAFAECAADARWLGTHLLQLFGTMLFLVIGMLSLYRSLQSVNGHVRGLTRLGLAVSLIAFTTYAVDIAIDGIALKRAVGMWTGTATSSKLVYFAVAEGIRWLEYGVLGISGTFQGLAVLLFSLSMMWGTTYSKWAGALGAIGGIALVVTGVVTVSSGFSTVQQVGVQLGFLANSRLESYSSDTHVPSAIGIMQGDDTRVFLAACTHRPFALPTGGLECLPLAR